MNVIKFIKWLVSLPTEVWYGAGLLLTAGVLILYGESGKEYIIATILFATAYPVVVGMCDALIIGVLPLWCKGMSAMLFGTEFYWKKVWQEIKKGFCGYKRHLFLIRIFAISYVLVWLLIPFVGIAMYIKAMLV